MKHLLSFTSNSGEKPGTSCIFPGRTLSNNSMNEDSLALTSMYERIDDSWTPEAVGKDVGKINYLYSLANTYNSKGNDWYSLTGDTVSEYDQLCKLQFPDTWKQHPVWKQLFMKR